MEHKKRAYFVPGPPGPTGPCRPLPVTKSLIGTKEPAFLIPRTWLGQEFSRLEPGASRAGEGCWCGE